MSEESAEFSPPIVQLAVVVSILDEPDDAHRAATNNPAHRFFDAAGRPVVTADDSAAAFAARSDAWRDVELRGELRAAFAYVRERARQRPDMLRAAGYLSLEELDAHCEDLLGGSDGAGLVPKLRRVLSPAGVRWPEPDGSIRRVCCLCGTCKNCEPPPPGGDDASDAGRPAVG